MRACSALALVAALAGFALPAAAHRLAPSYLALEAHAEGRVAALFRTPRVVARGARVTPQWPAGCTPAGEPAVSLEKAARVAKLVLDCGERGLVGRRIGVIGLAESGTDALVEVQLANGSRLRTVLTANRPSWQIPEREPPLAALLAAVRLGVMHLLSGPDHLLFLLGLLLLLPAPRALAVAVTGFTIGHSATLALATLGALSLPPPLVEAAIAASLVVLAVEALGPAPERSAVARRPALVPLGFGLVHGLGFAGALSEAGVGAASLPLTLLGFNLGIELAQLACVLLAWPLARALARRRAVLPRALAELPATAIGALGFFWLLERGAGWLGSALG